MKAITYKSTVAAAAAAVAAMLGSPGAAAYPLDGYDQTQIRRLQPAELARARKLPAGAQLSMAEVVPSNAGVTTLPSKDEALSARLRDALGGNAGLYGVAILDVSDPENPHYIAHNPGLQANVGSVGKLLVLTALLNRLAELYPDDIAARESVLRDTRIVANGWAVYDEHTAPIYDAAARKIVNRTLRVGDSGNLYEYLDWMLSASNNGAASMVMQQLILLEKFGVEYPPSTAEREAFLNSSSAAEKGRLFAAVMDRGLAALNLDPAKIRQGSLFTSSGKKAVNGSSSYATPRDLLLILNAIESGRFVDGWASTEAKRLLYMTQRRIRYASHPVLNDAAVYFKSGSLYRCQAEAGFACRKYMGNVENRLASVAMVESPAGEPALRYMVVVMSNVLRVNSAVAHQTLALRIHRLVEAANRQRLMEQGVKVIDKALPAARVEDAEGTDR